MNSFSPFWRRSTRLIALFFVMIVLRVPAFAAPNNNPNPTPNSTPVEVWQENFHTQTDDESLLQFVEQSERDLPDAKVNITPISAMRGNGNMRLPVGQTLLKIEVAQAGIYQIQEWDWWDAGINPANINPHSLQLLHRGNPVAYQFIGDGNNSFDNGESLRFYGESVEDLPRLERQYVANNVYWLWANGTPTIAQTIGNPTGYPVAGSWRSKVTLEEENHWFATWSNKWHLFPNEPDAWFMDRLAKGAESTLTGSYDINLPHPAANGSDINLTVEVNSQTHPKVSGTFRPNVVEIQLNNSGSADATDSWYGIHNRNIQATLPASRIWGGTNSVQVTVAGITSANRKSTIYPNRITIEYDRQFVTDWEQFIFTDDQGGAKEFQISGFNNQPANEFVVWQINDPYQAQVITISDGDVNAGTIRVGSSHSAHTKFVATTTGKLLSPVQVSQYTPSNLTPSNGAEWLAISHANFMSQAQQLAAHRASTEFGGLSTHVVDIQDVINQYGYGLPLPSAIQDYLTEALTWQTPVQFVTLIGDSTDNPRHHTCTIGCMPNYNNHKPNFVPTVLAFVDRYQGMIPSDTALTFLTGNDTIPDVKLGRLSVQTPAQATAMIDKIIQFEQNLLTPEQWMKNVLFISDNTDNAGNFCQENLNAGTHLPNNLRQTHLCLPDNPTADDVTQLRTSFFNQLNSGTLLINYRGHGFPDKWGHESIISKADAGSWGNSNRPLVTITADCLDGYFTLPGSSSMSEDLLRLGNAGTAAHWSSTGLGLLHEHNVLHQNFYNALFNDGKTAIGDAINYAQLQYNAMMASAPYSYDVAELYAYTLQGDPAMQLMRPSLSVSHYAANPSAQAGEQLDLRVELSNYGVYPADSTIVEQLPAGLTYVGSSGSPNVTTSMSGDDVTISVDEPLGLYESVVVTITTQIDAGIHNPSPLVAQATASSPGLEAVPGDESAQALVWANGCLPPNAPSVTATQSNGQLQLNWLAGGGQEGYELHKLTGSATYYPSGYTHLTDLPAHATTYTDGLPNAGNATFYTLRATSCNGSAHTDANIIGAFSFDLLTQ